VSAESMEQRVKKLEEKFEKKVASLEREVERAKAVAEIQNLMNRMQYYHSIGKNSEMADKIFARKAPDVRLYFGENGYWEGLEAVRMVGNMGGGPPPKGENPNKGRMAMHLMLQPIIEVAKDGKTAQATFWAAGIMAGRDRKSGEPSASWEWNRYGDDFIKEDGEWRLWHHHVFPLFRIGYDEKWADQFKKKEGDMPVMKFPDELKPYYHPPTPRDVFYSPDELLPEIPPPQPYETWDPSQAY
jgi:hypothetical protein